MRTGKERRFLLLCWALKATFLDFDGTLGGGGGSDHTTAGCLVLRRECFPERTG